jgi:hypothetical protein
MKVDVLDGETVIGTGELDKLDPPMGGANGLFTPTAAYNRAHHAADIEGKANEAAANCRLTVRGPQGEIGCVAVLIADFREGLAEIELIVSGISDFETHFGNHPHYRQYYGLG